MRSTGWLVVAALATACCTACGYNSGFLHDNTSGDVHQYQMAIGAIRYVRSVSGSSSVGAALCVIPLGSGLFEQAMTQLHAQARLAPNEILYDVRQDNALSCYVLYGVTNLVISADVYEVTPAQAAPVAATKSPGAAQAGRAQDATADLSYATTFAQLQTAYRQIASETDLKKRRDTATSILGVPQAVDAGAAHWWGLPDASDPSRCYELRVGLVTPDIALVTTSDDQCKRHEARP